MAKQFNKERAKLSHEWQDEAVRFAKEVSNNRNLTFEQIFAKKAELDKLYDSFKDLPLFIEKEDL